MDNLWVVLLKCLLKKYLLKIIHFIQLFFKCLSFLLPYLPLLIQYNFSLNLILIFISLKVSLKCFLFIQEFNFNQTSSICKYFSLILHIYLFIFCSYFSRHLTCKLPINIHICIVYIKYLHRVLVSHSSRCRVIQFRVWCFFYLVF